MVKRFILLTLLTASTALYADNVPETRARKAAESFFNQISTKTSAPRLTLVNTNLTKAATGEQEYYVYNNSNGGFVIISGDDAIDPVLAYSRTTSVDMSAMPENVRTVYEQLADYVSYVKEQGLEATASVSAKWELFDSGEAPKAATQKVLETAKWNQSAPYNNMSPIVDGQRSITGCVATATCIVMYYHKWPEKGTGTLPSYSYKTKNNNTQTISGHELTAEYDWDNMLMSYKGSYTQKQADAVAQLMYDVGIMVKMMFNPSSSGAYSSDVPTGLKKYMGYKNAHLEYMSRYTTAKWVSMLKTEIDTNGPVIYSAQSDTGGHEFVVDGYDSDDKLHINFGWGGSSYDGFYTLPDFYKYNRSHDAVFDLNIDESYKPVLTGGLSYSSFTTTAETFAVNAPFEATISGLAVSKGNSFKGRVSVQHCNSKGAVVETVASSNVDLASGKTGSLSLVCTLAKAFSPGDYLAPVCFLDGDSNSRDMEFKTASGGSKTIELTINFDAQVSMTFDKSTGAVVFTSLPGTEYSLTRSGTLSTNLNSKMNVSNGRAEFNVSSMKGYTVKLKLTFGSQTKTFTLNL